MSPVPGETGALWRPPAPSAQLTTRLVRRVLADPQLLTSLFQPIVSLGTGRIVGFEALARLATDPDHAPVAVFRRAHAMGLGAEFEALAVGRALDIADASNLAPGTFVSVNVSPVVLDHPAVWRVLGGRDVRHVVLELTEDDAVDDYPALRRTMDRYLALGATFAIDDAGAGFASMRHITELWPTFFKLDALLTRRLDQDPRRQALVRALAMLATDVDATLVIEGVERASDLSHLAQTGLPLLVQGYAIARPGEPWPEISVQAGRALATASSERTGEH